jgi:hypothetical protein
MDELDEVLDTLETTPDAIEEALWPDQLEVEEYQRLYKKLQDAEEEGPDLLNKIRTEIARLPYKQRGQFLDRYRGRLQYIGILEYGRAYNIA